ncbi:MAG: two-component system response regulator BtsR, partial [Shewanella sp.]
MISCIIVDDEPLARDELAELLASTDDIEVIAQCANAIEALSAINRLKPQLVFLDIQMPQISGIELLAMLDPETMPRVVFATAYDDYALKAFEYHAYDYLLKPLDESRLAQTLDKVRRDLRPKLMPAIVPDELTHLPCYCGNRLRVVKAAAVEYVFSDLSGIHVVTNDHNVHTQLTLKILEEKTAMVRCHRQYLIMPAAIAEIEPLESGGQAI